MEFTGERVVFDKMSNNDAEVRVLQKHLERYVWALKFVREKIVLDAACGTGYGTWLLSLVASRIFGTDKNKEAIDYAKRYFHAEHDPETSCRIEISNYDFFVDDLDKPTVFEDIDTVVSFETIEHLEHPEKFLEAINGKELIFSIPLNSPSEFHKQVYESEEAVISFIESFGWDITDKWLQDDKYFVGRALWIK
jgi:SAM-dependent methyltransferase